MGFDIRERRYTRQQSVAATGVNVATFKDWSDCGFIGSADAPIQGGIRRWRRYSLEDVVRAGLMSGINRLRSFPIEAVSSMVMLHADVFSNFIIRCDQCHSGQVFAVIEYDERDAIPSSKITLYSSMERAVKGVACAMGGVVVANNDGDGDAFPEIRVLNLSPLLQNIRSVLNISVEGEETSCEQFAGQEGSAK